MAHVRLRRSPHLYFVAALPSKTHITANIDIFDVRDEKLFSAIMCNWSKPLLASSVAE